MYQLFAGSDGAPRGLSWLLAQGTRPRLPRHFRQGHRTSIWPLACKRTARFAKVRFLEYAVVTGPAQTMPRQRAVGETERFFCYPVCHGVCPTFVLILAAVACLQVERHLCVRRRRGTLRRGSTQVSPCLCLGVYGRRDRGTLLLYRTTCMHRCQVDRGRIRRLVRSMRFISYFVPNLRQIFKRTNCQLLNASLRLCSNMLAWHTLARSQPAGDKSDAADGLCLRLAANRQARACFLLA